VADWLKLLGLVFESELSGVRLIGGPGGRLVTAMAGARAVTLGRWIFLSPSAWRSLERGGREGLELLAHEVAHVVQYRCWGVIAFLWEYLRDYLALRVRGQGHRAAYRNLRAEREARACERICSRLLLRRPLLGMRD
jgi:hypothetical protein